MDLDPFTPAAAHEPAADATHEPDTLTLPVGLRPASQSPRLRAGLPRGARRWPMHCGVEVDAAATLTYTAAH